MLLSHKALLRQQALGPQFHRRQHASGRGQFDGRALPPAQRCTVEPGAVRDLFQPTAAQARGRGGHHHHVVPAVGHSTIQHLAQQIAPLEQSQPVQQQVHGVAVARVANGLVVQVAHAAGQRFAQRAQAA